MAILSTFPDGERLDYNSPNDFTANASGRYVKSGTIAKLHREPITTQYIHTQATAALTWVVNHNLNAQVDTVSIWIGGRRFYADYQIINNNTLEINFSTAQSGSAVIEI